MLTIVVPEHKELDRGTLWSIIGQSELLQTWIKNIY
jgi:hypothetical protein